MYCPKCGKENEDGDNFCISCGEELGFYKGKNLQGTGMKSVQNYENQVDNTHYSYSGRSIENNEIQLASLGSRIGAYLIDMLIMIVLVILIVGIIIASVQASALADDLAGLLILGCFLVPFGYFILLEGPLGKGMTIGKRALNLRVVKKDQSMVGYGASFGRNVLRIIDMLPFLYILGIILISDSDLNQRLGDMAAGTIVIKENDYENKYRPTTSLDYS